ncbi:hypothetical protein P10159_4126 [Citrobacter portucalensis]|nr:hypothetical protein P10159_4126 [Citrobacter portucalensis]
MEKQSDANRQILIFSYTVFFGAFRNHYSLLFNNVIFFYND